MGPPPRQPRIVPPEAAYQWLFSPSDMAETPSVRFAHLSTQHERSLRAKAINLVNRIGEYLRLPQSITSTASIFLHRFYMRRCLNSETLREQSGYAPYEMAATTVFLACKCEETSKKLGTIVEATMASLDKSTEGTTAWSNRKYKVNPDGPEFRRWKDIILTYEERLLDTLCFDLIVDHPHKALVVSAAELKAEKLLTRTAWAVLNDCLHDAMCVMFDPPVLAAGAFKKACDEMGIDPATMTLTIALDAAEIAAAAGSTVEGSTSAASSAQTAELSWLDVFDVDEAEVAEVAAAIDDAYAFHQGGIGKRTNPASAAAVLSSRKAGSTTPAGATTPRSAHGNSTPLAGISRSSSETALRRPARSPPISQTNLPDEYPTSSSAAETTATAPAPAPAPAPPTLTDSVLPTVPEQPDIPAPAANINGSHSNGDTTMHEASLSGTDVAAAAEAPTSVPAAAASMDGPGEMDVDVEGDEATLPTRPQSRHGPPSFESGDVASAVGRLEAVGEATDSGQS